MTMKSGQLIEHNMGIFSFENSCTKCGGETFLRPFLRKKNHNWAYLWVNSLILYTVCFYCMSKLQSTKITKVKLRCWPPAFTWYKAILKNKKRSGTNLFASFFTWFLKKNITHVIFYWLRKFCCLAAFTFWDSRQYVFQLFVIQFERS